MNPLPDYCNLCACEALRRVVLVVVVVNGGGGGGGGNVSLYFVARPPIKSGDRKDKEEKKTFCTPCKERYESR